MRLAFGGLATLVLASLGPLPAQAVVIVAGDSQAAREQLASGAREAGLRHREVMGIEMLFATAPKVRRGTGVYLGESADGAKGLALTAAHLFLDDDTDETRVPLEVRLFFDCRSEGGIETVQVPVCRILLHPGCRVVRDDRSGDGSRLTAPKRLLTRDLAILEFDAPRHREAFRKHQITPAPLYDGKGYTKPLLEAELVGFGQFGFSDAPMLEEKCIAYAGRARVSYGTWRGVPGFQLWFPAAPESIALIDCPEPCVNKWRFDCSRPMPVAFDPFDRKSPIPMAWHPSQAVAAKGDSGGPLFFKKDGKLQVAGILSAYYCESPVKDDQAPVPCLVQIWEPVRA